MKPKRYEAKSLYLFFFGEGNQGAWDARYTTAAGATLHRRLLASKEERWVKVFVFERADRTYCARLRNRKNGDVQFLPEPTKISWGRVSKRMQEDYAKQYAAFMLREG